MRPFAPLQRLSVSGSPRQAQLRLAYTFNCLTGLYLDSFDPKLLRRFLNVTAGINV